MYLKEIVLSGGEAASVDISGGGRVVYQRGVQKGFTESARWYTKHWHLKGSLVMYATLLGVCDKSFLSLCDNVRKVFRPFGIVTGGWY